MGVEYPRTYAGAQELTTKHPALNIESKVGVWDPTMRPHLVYMNVAHVED